MNETKKPKLRLTRGDTPEKVIELYEAMTGKKATPEELQEVREIMERKD